MKRFFLELSYEGSAYKGWQRQPNANSVQETIEEGLATLLRQEVSIVGAGRTDAGVHAKQLFAHLDLDMKFSEAKALAHRLNAYLPNSIAINSIVEVLPTAHARFDASQRSYEYVLTPHKNPFLVNNAYYHSGVLCFKSMNEAAERLKKFTDFQCFSKSNTDVKTFDCSLTNAVWEQGQEYWVFKISANRFLRNMVRAIVGTLLEVGKGNYLPEYIDKIVESKDRSQAGFSVPAHGLFLTEVRYPSNIFIENEK